MPYLIGKINLTTLSSSVPIIKSFGIFNNKIKNVVVKKNLAQKLRNSGDLNSNSSDLVGRKTSRIVLFKGLGKRAGKVNALKSSLSMKIKESLKKVKFLKRGNGGEGVNKEATLKIELKDGTRIESSKRHTAPVIINITNNIYGKGGEDWKVRPHSAKKRPKESAKNEGTESIELTELGDVVSGGKRLEGRHVKVISKALGRIAKYMPNNGRLMLSGGTLLLVVGAGTGAIVGLAVEGVGVVPGTLIGAGGGVVIGAGIGLVGDIIIWGIKKHQEKVASKELARGVA